MRKTSEYGDADFVEESDFFLILAGGG